MQLKFLGILLIFTSLLFACQKDELKYEKSLLEGKWKWVSSKRWVSFQGDIIDISYLDANIYADEYGVEFDRKGHVTYLTNSNEVSKYRIVFNFFKEVIYPPYKNYKFLILLNNRMKNQLEGRINVDTLFIKPSHIPLQNATGGTLDTVYSHYFLRDN